MTYNNQNIADQLGITRQALSNSLKRSIPKIYKKYKNRYNTNSYETYVYLVTGFGIKSEKDMKAFFDYLPKEVQYEIQIEVIEKYPNFKNKI